jgi:ribosomal protein S18 acetylase RimI-like enzyme
MNFKYKYSKYKAKYLQLIGGNYLLNTDKIKDITMLNLEFADFFKFLDNNEKIKQHMEHHMKLDLKQQEDINIDSSVIDMWKNNKKLKQLNTRFIVLLNEQDYVGSFRYYTTELTKIFNVHIPRDIYTKIGIVYVNPKYRRMGIMYEALRTFMNNNGRYVLVVDNNNDKAIKLYNKLGFIKYGSNDGNSTFIK